MFAERLQKIADIVGAHGKISVDGLAGMTGLSAVTVRRYLRLLEDRGEVIRTHGGASAVAYQESADRSREATGERVPSSDGPDAVIAGSGAPHDDQFLIRQFVDRKIPIIAESEPVAGMTSRVTIDDERAATDLGRWVADYLRDHQDGRANMLDLTWLNENMQLRSDAFFRTIREFLPDAEVVVSLSVQEGAYQLVYDALHLHKKVNVVFAANDLLAVAAIKACRALDKSGDSIVVVTVGLEDETMLHELEIGDFCKAGIALMPQFIAANCMLSATRAIAGDAVPSCTLTPHVLLTSDTVAAWYSRNGGEYQLRWDRAATRFGDVRHEIVETASRLPARSRSVRFIEPAYPLRYFRIIHQTLVDFGSLIDTTVERVDYNLLLRFEHERRLDDIAAVASMKVKDGDVVVLSTGAISYRIAANLRRRSRVTTITNSLEIFEALRESHGSRVVLVGGQYEPVQDILTGPLAETMMHSLKSSWFFLEPVGVTPEFVAMSTSAGDIPILRAFIESAAFTVIVADHLVFNRTGMMRICDASEIDGLICDNALPASTRVRLRDLGVKVETTRT